LDQIPDQGTGRVKSHGAFGFQDINIFQYVVITSADWGYLRLKDSHSRPLTVNTVNRIGVNLTLTINNYKG